MVIIYLHLKHLEQDFTNRIKCIYIDPPYNTGNALEHYDDGLEHSIWLSLMKPRLEILQKLLSKDGIIFISIDDEEQAYLKLSVMRFWNEKIIVVVLFGKKKNHHSFPTWVTLTNMY